jgi:hypothetical protein
LLFLPAEDKFPNQSESATETKNHRDPARKDKDLLFPMASPRSKNRNHETAVPTIRITRNQHRARPAQRVSGEDGARIRSGRGGRSENRRGRRRNRDARAAVQDKGRRRSRSRSRSRIFRGGA